MILVSFFFFFWLDIVFEPHMFAEDSLCQIRIPQVIALKNTLCDWKHGVSLAS